MNQATSLIIRMPNWLGDCVMASPLLQDCKEKLNLHITCMVKPSLVDLFVGNPYVDEIFQYTQEKTFYHRLENHDTIEKIKQGHFDLGLLLPNSFSSAWWFFRAKVQRTIGFKKDLRSWLLTDPVAFPCLGYDEHLVTTYKRLLQPLGIPISETLPKLFTTDQEKSLVDSFLASFNIKKEQLLIGINPSAAYGNAKCWPKERYRELIKQLQDPHKTFLLFGDASAKELCHWIAKDLDENVINLAGRTTLRELICLIERCHLFITNDSGPMHIAAALKRPMIALFGSTSDIKTGPYRHGRVIHKHVSCSPCYKRECPIDFRCMKKITVEEVKKEALSLLETPNAYLRHN